MSELKKTRKVIHRVNLSGLSHHDYALVANQITVGTRLPLARDPSNAYDANAIKVLFPEDAPDAQVQIGWIPKEENPILAKLLDAGFELIACVISHDMSIGALDRRLYCGIYITALVSE